MTPLLLVVIGCQFLALGVFLNAPTFFTSKLWSKIYLAFYVLAFITWGFALSSL